MIWMEAEQMSEVLDRLEEDLDNVRRVVKFCEEKGLDPEFMVHPVAKTVKQSSEHTNTSKEKIVKTLVFIADEKPIAVLAPGHEDVDEEKLAEVTGAEEIDMAEYSEVEEETGYIVGGVSPFDLDIPVYGDKRILQHEKVKPAAGSRVVGCMVDPEQLFEAVDAEAVEL